MKKLGLGVLGLGEGRSIISAGVNSDLWDVVQLCDVNEDLCRSRCAEFGLKHYTDSYEEMLSNDAVDVVGIYTPDHLHADHVLSALNAGKHVIVTKPFVDDLSRGPELIEACERSGKYVMVGQSSRFFPPFRRQREHFESGDFGDIVAIEAYYHADHSWFLEKSWARTNKFKWLYGGLSHPVDLIRWYVPDIVEVMGYANLSETGKRGGLVHPDSFQFVMKSSSGQIARVSGGYSLPVVPNSRDSDMSCILRCENGVSQGDYYDLRYAWKSGGKSVVESFEDQDAYYFRFGGHSHHAGEYQNYIEYFARCLEYGTQPKPDIHEGLGTVALMQAMERSAQQGGAVGCEM